MLITLPRLRPMKWEPTARHPINASVRFTSSTLRYSSSLMETRLSCPGSGTSGLVIASPRLLMSASTCSKRSKRHLHRALPAVRRGRVRRQSLYWVPGGRHVSRERLQVALGERRDQDSCASLGQYLGDAAADPARRAGNDNRPAIDVELRRDHPATPSTRLRSADCPTRPSSPRAAWPPVRRCAQTAPRPRRTPHTGVPLRSRARRACLREWPG